MQGIRHGTIALTGKYCGGSAAAETGHHECGGFRMRGWTKLFRDVPHLPRRRFRGDPGPAVTPATQVFSTTTRDIELKLGENDTKVYMYFSLFNFI
jgi:hypothetical protein